MADGHDPYGLGVAEFVDDPIDADAVGAEFLDEVFG